MRKIWSFPVKACVLCVVIDNIKIVTFPRIVPEAHICYNFIYGCVVLNEGTYGGFGGQCHQSFCSENMICESQIAAREIHIIQIIGKSDVKVRSYFYFWARVKREPQSVIKTAGSQRGRS